MTPSANAKRHDEIIFIRVKHRAYPVYSIANFIVPISSGTRAFAENSEGNTLAHS